MSETDQRRGGHQPHPGDAGARAKISDLLASASADQEDLLTRSTSLGSALAADLLDPHGVSPAHRVDPVLISITQALLDSPQKQRPALRAVLTSFVRQHLANVTATLLSQQESIHQASLDAYTLADAQRRKSEARFAALFADAPVGIGIGDLEGNILEVNDALIGIFGYSDAEMRARSVQSFAHPDDGPEIWPLYEQLITGKVESFHTEKRFVHSSGRVLWTELSVSLIRDEAGAPTHQIAVIQDITARHELAHQLWHTANHDPLTGLANRRLFESELRSAIAAAGVGKRLTLCFVDLDDFKMINSVRGHLVGDEVLLRVGRRLQAAAPPDAVLARFGGDEFVLFADTSAHEGAAVEMAEQLLASLREPLELRDSRPISVRASVGLIELPADEASPENLLRAADLAVRAAKEDGRGRVMIHDPNRTARQLSRVKISLGLDGLTLRDELHVKYQPMVRLGDGGLHGMEALARWRHPELGELKPHEFIPLAEDSGDIVLIGEWVISEACQRVARADWPAVNVNMSVHQLYRPSLVDDVMHHLGEAEISPDRLRVEVTESMVINPNDSEPLRAMRDLAELGVCVVLDDFGTGYSNIAAIRQLPVQEVKLASTFLGGAQSVPDRIDRRLLAGMVDIVHDLGLSVTIEGVESATQDEWVREVGCDVAQGWFYDHRWPS